nr:copper resistance protein CopC [Micromonospora sp. DSM 115978]
MTAAPGTTTPAVGVRGATRNVWPRRVAAGGVLVLVGTVVALVLLAEAKPAAITAADPGDGQRLDVAPAAVALAFNGRLDPADSHIAVADAAGRPVITGTARVAAETITQPIDPLPAGRYQVAYHVTFGNGTVLTDLYSFTVGGPESAPGAADQALAPPVVTWTTPPPDEAAGGHDHGVLDPGGMVMIGAYFGIILVGLVVLHRRRRRQH